MFNPFKKTYETDEMEMLSILGDLVLFSSLTNDQRALFLPHLHKRTYEKKEVVFLFFEILNNGGCAMYT